ncbi:MFS transporter [Sphingobacterium corticibacter]|uniref:MFS transporter n=1 Tax=Sphingobacterium corticibacter TaxID=2171749 RepID=A0A2T8HIZ2_9SPHI|nr:MFS transporter [Sphingobacterium corticibacter]PVH25418.1 MFS transporter [Sphingobacterium corticibacter]
MNGQKNLKQVIIASATGSLIEWYDLLLAIILSPTLSRHLFPEGESRFLETLAIVVSSYLIRPLGSLVFGFIGDKSGRKKSFLLSLLLMGGATFLIGCIPTFGDIGWLAPLALLILRLCQGLAVSGEYAGGIIYVAEHAPKGKRGFYTGFIQATIPLGLLICLLVVYTTEFLMTAETFEAYGWRIPFLLSALLVGVSYYIRRNLGESPMYKNLKTAGKLSTNPVKETFKTKGNMRLILLAVFGGNAAQATIMQSAQFLTLFFLQRSAYIEFNTSILILGTATLLALPFFQYFSALSDRIGRKKVIIPGLLLSAVSLPIIFYGYGAIGNPDGLQFVHSISVISTLKLAGLSFILCFASAVVYGPMGIFLLELFPTKIRYTSMAFAYNIGNGVLGGSTTLIGEALRKSAIFSPIIAPFIILLYPLILIVTAIIVSLGWVPETYHNSLHDEEGKS